MPSGIDVSSGVALAFVSSSDDATSRPGDWFWKWCVNARPREQLFRFLAQSVRACTLHARCCL